MVFCYWCFCVEVGGLFVLVFWYWDLVVSFNLAQAQAMAGIPHHIFQECRQRGSSGQRGRPRSPSPLRRLESWSCKGQTARGYRITPWQNGSEELYRTILSVSVTDGGSITIHHAGVNNIDDLDWVTQKLRNYVDTVRTPYVDIDSDEGAQTRFQVMQWLNDLHERVQQLFQEGDKCRAKDFFCRPWIVTRGVGTVVLRLTKDVGIARTIGATLMSPLILPLAVCPLLVGESPASAMRIGFRYTVLRILEKPSQVCLDSGYSVQEGGPGVADLAQAIASGIARGVGSNL